jgi:predicted transcriptional regulator
MERKECNSRTLKKVLRHLTRYQKRDEAGENNYINEIKRELDISQVTCMKALDVLESMGVISNKAQEGRKTIYYVHQSIMKNMDIKEEFEEEDGSRPSLERKL